MNGFNTYECKVCGGKMYLPKDRCRRCIKNGRRVESKKNPSPLR